ncbi:SDR family oxidoreductase [Solicola sp. PLA-1-18]|uniref:SDR family oxidoreductase n=1 Tax=Solicola sp. PLA-1-18 TaxID=3380532 RepID=UPI003B7F275B
MSIVVTGATGQLGRLVVAALLERGVPAADVLATGRDADKLAGLESDGVRTRRVDLDDPATLDGAFAAGDTVLLVSTDAVGQRVAQHTAAIEAAAEAGVASVVYTSAPHADTSGLVLAPEHKATEEVLRASGVPFTVLRNNWYTENYLPQVEQARATGALVASAADGRVASATRRDFAEGAAVVLTTDGHEGRTYELSGDVAWSFDDLADVLGDLTGRAVVYRPVSSEEHQRILVQAGLDEGTAGFVATLDANIARGDLADATSDLRDLIGRPTTTLRDGLTEAAAG